MSFWSRISNLFRRDGLSAEIDEEFAAHIQEAIEHGRDSAEARRAFGSLLQRREESRDIRIVAWLDALRGDAVFGWRQLMKRKPTSAAAILSLALGMGAFGAAFRLIDALLLRPMPVANPHQLYELSRHITGPDGIPHNYDGWAYPVLRLMRAAVADQAELLAIGGGETELTFASDQEMERAMVQYVSGRMFGSFGLHPALGRLLIGADDREPGAHPYAVLSEDYWTRRFARDPHVIGRTFRMENRLFEIVGVCAGPFTGTETGFVTAIFVPTMMNAAIGRADSESSGAYVRLRPGVSPERVETRLNAVSLQFERERAKGWAGASQQTIDTWLAQRLVLQPAAAGFSGLQKAYRRPSAVLGVLVALVLLITCANVANLMNAQAAARAREMALRVSIGAGRGRLVQLVLVQAAWAGVLSAVAGAFLAWWAAPCVLGMLRLGDSVPARLEMPCDGHIFGFGLALTLAVTLLFGLAPALRASHVTPASAIKGGDDPHSRRRLMQALVAGQAAFCFLVLYLAGMFVTTFEKLSQKPTGFSADRLLNLSTVTSSPQPPAAWDQVMQQIRRLPGVETAVLVSHPLLSGWSNNDGVAIDGGPPSADMAYFLNVSPGFVDAMKIPFLDGRDFRAGDVYPGQAIVSEAFAKRFFRGANPVGRWFERVTDEGPRMRIEIIGLVRDARYLDMRGPMLPIAYVPFRAVDAHDTPEPIARGTIVVRTANRNPRALAEFLRKEVAKAKPGFRVRGVETQEELNLIYTHTERLLAVLASFFAMVALVLAGVGLYGVLQYSVQQRQRELGIRLAIGAQSGAIVRLVAQPVFALVLAGGLAGLALGIVSVRSIASLFYGIKPTDPRALAVPSMTILLAAALASLPAVMRAVRIDPAAVLRRD